MDFYSLLKPLLFQLEPETAHHAAVCGARFAGSVGLLGLLYPHRAHEVELMGLRLSNPIGLAAGFDKDGTYFDVVASLGFGFIEVGTVTPRPQRGNPRPRLFRLPEHKAVINRMGFNNSGVNALLKNLSSRKHRPVMGINIGANKDTPSDRRGEDYLFCLEKVYPFADYIVVNISSPNTPGLRDLQQIRELGPLLQSLRQRKSELRDSLRRDVPLVLKIAPDLADDDIRAIAGLLLENNFSGVIATNTTIDRPVVRDHKHGSETGGLSGEPLKPQSLHVVRCLAESLGGAIPIIGCGGITCGSDALEHRAAGAKAVQLYTGLIYRGPGLIAECVKAWAGE